MRILIGKGASINMAIDGGNETVLHCVARYAFKYPWKKNYQPFRDLIHLLLAHGADPYLKDATGKDSFTYSYSQFHHKRNGLYFTAIVREIKAKEEPSSFCKCSIM